MAQTTAQLSAVDAKVEVSTNGSTWVDISGSANKVDAGTQERSVGQAFTFDGDGALLTYGKRQPIEVAVTCIYTETASTEAFEVVRALFETENGAAIYLRWQPVGTGTGKAIYSTGSAKLKSFQYPPIEAESADPVLFEFVVVASTITRSISS